MLPTDAQNLRLSQKLLLFAGLCFAAYLGVTVAEQARILTFAERSPRFLFANAGTITLVATTGLTLGIPFVLWIRYVIGFTLVLFATGLRLHFMPSNATFGDVGALGLGLVMFPYAIAARRPITLNGIHYLLLLLMTLLLVLMYVRGFSFLLLGDASRVGGYRYVDLFLGCFFFFAATIIPSPWRFWKTVFVLIAVLSMVRLGVEIVGKLVGLPSFITGAFSVFLGREPFDASPLDGPGYERFRAAKETATYTILATLALIRPHWLVGRQLLWLGPVLLALLVIGLISGHRIVFAMVFLLLAYYGLLTGILRLRTLLVGLAAAPVAAGMLWLVVYTVNPHLPLNMQRATSIIPGIEAQEVAREDAVGSLDWRYNIWELAWETEVPRYLWLGKGFIFSFFDVELGQRDLWAIANSTYHNGPLSVLIILGLPGVALYLLLFGCAVFRHVRISRRAWNQPQLKTMHAALLAWLLMELTIFFVLYGDAYQSLFNFLIIAGSMEAVRFSDNRAPKADADADRTPPLPANPFQSDSGRIKIADPL